MKKSVLYIYIVLCSILLFGCKSNILTKDIEKNMINNEKDQIVDKNNLSLEKNVTVVQSTEIEGDTISNVKKVDDNKNKLIDNKADEMSNEATVFESVTGDNLFVAQEFAKDLLTERFDRLQQGYRYDSNMQKAMSTTDMMKTVIYKNKTSGTLEDIMEAYVISYGPYQYVFVPINCSFINYNIQIVFDGKQNILGFSYVAYEDKKSNKDLEKPETMIETEYTFESNGYTLKGTLTTPTEGNNWPVVLLVQGAGPSDRDESIYMNKPFQNIAWGLAEKGIASFRYDKRSYLYTEIFNKNQENTVYDEIIEDVVAAAKLIQNMENVDSEKIYILGHSLGGYVLPRIAEEFEEAVGFIFMSAPATHIRNHILSIYEAIVIEDGKVSNREQQVLNSIRKEVLLLGTPDEIPEDRKILGYYKDYWLDLAYYEPIETARNITVPVMVLQGMRDYQVSITHFDIWKENFEVYNNWSFKSYETLNHFMMEGTGISNSFEYKIKSKVSNEVIDDIVDFVLNQ